jgi:hypothetical protein
MCVSTSSRVARVGRFPPLRHLLHQLRSRLWRHRQRSRAESLLARHDAKALSQPRQKHKWYLAFALTVKAYTLPPLCSGPVRGLMSRPVTRHPTRTLRGQQWLEVEAGDEERVVGSQKG